MPRFPHTIGPHDAAANAPLRRAISRTSGIPCTQMKDHEALPPIPIRRGQGAWLEDYDGQALPRRHQLLVGESVRARQSAINAAVRAQLERSST